jgi:autotransporter-associated beta strand protein
LFLPLAQHLDAAVFYWDPNGLSAPTSGTWDTTSLQWATSSVLTASPVAWNTANAAVFPAGASGISALTITVNSSFNFAGIFNGVGSSVGVTNLTISGSGSLNLNGGLQGFFTGNSLWNTLIRVPITGSGGLQNQSGGSLYLSGNNTFSGGVSLGTGAGLNFNNGNAFGTGPITNAVTSTVLATPATDSTATAFATAPITVTNTFGTYGASNSTIIFVGIAAAPVTFSGPWILAAPATTNTTFQNQPAGTTVTISGPISGPPNFTKAGAGALVLSGANTYSGKTVVGNGTVSVSSLNKVAGGSANSSLGHPTTAANGTIGLGATTTAGTLIYTGTGETTDRVIDLAGTTGGGIIQNDGSGALTFSSAFTASGAGVKTLTLQGSYTGSANTISGAIVNSGSATALTKAGNGSWTLNGVNTFSGATAISGGTLTIGGSGQLNSGSYAGVISGGGTFTYNSLANQILSGGNTFTGTFNLNSGAIGVGNSAAFGAAGATVNINGGKFGNNSATGRTIPSGVTLNINADFTVDDSFFTTGANGQILFNGGTATLRNGNRTINVDQPNGQTVNLGILSVIGQDAPGRGIIKTGSGILALTGANTYSGDTTINAGQININGTSTLGDATGTLHLSGGALNTTATRTASTAPVANPLDVTADSSITTSSTAATVDLNLSSTIGGSAGTLTFKSTSTGGFKPRFSGSGFTFSRPIAIDNGSGSTLLQSFNTNGTDQTFSGAISGNGSFSRTASTSGTGGRTIFNASAGNTYSGGTTVNDGVLMVNNTTGSGTGSGAVAVNANGTLGGNGTIAGATTVNGTLAPGASIGTLTFGSSLSLLGTTRMEIDRAASPNADKIVMSSGTATLGGNLTVVNLGGALALGDTFDLIDGTIAGAFASMTLPSLPAGLAWNTSQLAPGGDGTIRVVCDGTLSASAGANTNACSGNGTVIGGSPTASGGSGSGYSYSWSPTTGLNDPTLANPTASPANATTYTVTVTDSVGCTSQSSMTVSVDVAPAISTPPSSQTACSGSTATFSVSATGSGLSYSWAKHSNGGWGSAWATSGSGSTFRSSSTDNDFGDTACTSFTSASDINSPSGNALGMWGGFSGDEIATRTFAALTSGQAVSIDFDNGNVDSGSKVGFSLQTSGGADVLQFYFLGGASNYKYNDGTEQDTGIPFQRTGLRVQFSLTSASTYSLIVTPCGGTPTHFTGSYSGTIAQLKLFSQNNTGGNDKNIYFNNFIVGGYLDNADNYSGDYAGQDKGDQPIASGNGGSSYTTPALTTGDNGTQYEVVVGGCGGALVSSAATLTVNTAPTASTGGNQTICAGTSTAGLGGSVGGGATGGTWSSSGTGTFAPDATTLNASYTPSAGDIAAGSVTLTLTTTGQLAPCTPATAQLIVTINPAPTASAGANQTICAGSGTAALGGSVGGSATGGTWSSSGTGTFVPDATTLNASYTPSAADISAGTVTLTLSSTGQLPPCAPATAQVVVTINPAATASAGGNQTICSGSSTAGLGGSVGGGATGGTWSSSGSGTFVPNATTLNATYSPSAADISAGTVTLTLTSSGQLAPCPAATAQVVVTINPAASASAGGNQTICAGNSTAGLGGSVGGGATGGTWSSSGTGSFSPDTTTLNATYTPSAADISTGSVTLTLTTTGQLAPCAAATAQVVVTIDALPAITNEPSNLTVCAGSPAIFSVAATGASLVYQWQVSADGGTTFTNISDSATNASYTNLVTTVADNGNQYQVIVSGACSPPVTSAPPALLTVNTPATANAGANQSICAGSSTAGLGGSVGGGASGGTWSSSGIGTFVPDATTLNASYTPSVADISAGTVALTLTSTGQSAPCPAATAQVIVTINPLPTADAGPDRLVCPNRPVAIGGSPTASGGSGPYSYSWSPTAGLSDPTAANPLATITGMTTYTVTVMDANGCTGTDSVVLAVAPQPNILSITNSGTSVTLVWSSMAGETYRVQYKNDLSDLTWTDLSPDVTASGPTATTTDSVSAVTQRFYRISFVCP